ncbi:hypothetical protein PHLCEN_2v5111, partial [Hermanssonia centrifuga]
FCQDAENGIIQINAEDFPCFLYPEDSYNLDNVEEGLLCGEFLCSGRFSICGQEGWALKDGRYKLEDLFNNIVELFDNPSDS